MDIDGFPLHFPSSNGRNRRRIAIHQSRFKQKKSEERQKELVEKQERMSERMNKKEELREMASQLSEVTDWLEEFREKMSYSLDSTTIPDELDMNMLDMEMVEFCQDIIGYHHFSNEPTIISVDVCYYDENEERVPITSAETALQIDNDDTPRSSHIGLSLKDEVGYNEGTIYCLIDRSFTGASKYRYRIASVENEYSELINDFSPNLLDEVDEHINKMMERSMESAIESGKYIEISPEDYDSIPEMANDLFDTIMRYEGIEEDLDELDRLINEIEETRKGALQTSYS